MKELDKLDDKQLLCLMKQDSEKAFEQLYLRYKNKMHSFSALLLKSNQGAQDIVQEVFTSIWINRAKLNTHQSFSSYLYTLTRNRTLNELRNVSSFEQIDLMIENQKDFLSDENVEMNLILKEYNTLLQEALASLPEERRRVYLMSREEGLTYKDIGKALGISHHTVQAYISDTVKSIRSYFVLHADASLIALYSVFLVNL